ncbi:uncharacterized protein LOC133884004 [Phragmites australis]|uniref:uncharacterized protein LOC133884004 n=1 Tax=Phragmites australis TaxID=29695 RepID=UPI002D791A0D|nr:uncharacterized protein LOC133884004 [Phragmites australis]
MEEGGLTATASPQWPTSPRAAEAMAALPSWEDVPDNILVRVSAFLPCRADRVHMACVNRLWNAAMRGLRRPPPPVLPPLPPLPPQLPWLIFPSTEAPTFFSAITRCHQPLCRLPPDVRRARCCGSGDGGWLVLALDSCHAYALYNLNSGQRIPLPPGFTTPMDKEFPLVVRAATLSAPPSPNPYMVAAIVLIASRSTAAFWSEGSESWYSAGRLLTVRPQDVIYYGGAFFFVTSREDIIAFWPTYGPNGNVTLARVDYDMQQREDYDADVGFVRGLGTMRRYLVESRGRLLMVVRYVYYEAGTEMLRVFGFRVTAPLTNVQRPRAAWENLGEELDGRMLFLGPGCSRSFEVAHYDGFEESMIYFLDEGFVSGPSVDDRTWYSFTDMGRYSMEEMTSEPWPPGRHPSRSDKAPPTWWLH